MNFNKFIFPKHFKIQIYIVYFFQDKKIKLFSYYITFNLFSSKKIFTKRDKKSFKDKLKKAY
ncbi:hypothetical protein CPX_001564 [Candidatus Phytoplasma pruni]|uniref:Uncharacterized protein n=1 Tax=Candidatus Phytoplasma pruni TaxID=479893 RepID=A0A0M1MZW6_9MOLU|nr:hypothetical protein CPX_001564 [Candidatus Phytoplasma pruni]